MMLARSCWRRSDDEGHVQHCPRTTRKLFTSFTNTIVGVRSIGCVMPELLSAKSRLNAHVTIAALWKYVTESARELYMSAWTYSDVLPSVILWNKGKVNFCINLFYLRKVLILTSLSPLPKENLLHCDIVGSLDIFTCWFLCSMFIACFTYLLSADCYHILVNKAVCCNTLSHVQPFFAGVWPLAGSLYFLIK